MCSGSEAGSYLRLVDSCITQLKAQGLDWFREDVLPTVSTSSFLGKRNGSRTCLVQTFGRSGTNLGRDGLRGPRLVSPGCPPNGIFFSIITLKPRVSAKALKPRVPAKGSQGLSRLSRLEYRQRRVQGYLAHKKTPPPRTLQ